MFAMASVRITLILFLALALGSLIFFFFYLHGQPNLLAFSAASAACQFRVTSPPGSHSNPFLGDLRSLPFAWNLLGLGWTAGFAPAPAQYLHIALFVKKWPFRSSSPGGLERHAFVLHTLLARRGHTIHVFSTTASSEMDSAHNKARPEAEADIREWANKGLFLHLFPRPDGSGKMDIDAAWEEFVRLNSTRPFDIVHSESVALPPDRAKSVGPSTVVSWHGISYEIIYSDIIRDLTRAPGEVRAPDLLKSLSERTFRVAEEVKFFPSYAHHVATSDHVGDVLQNIYQIGAENVHIILNGVDERQFRPDPAAGARFRTILGLSGANQQQLVLGAAGRLVKDKGYPLLFEAFSEILVEAPHTRLLLAGDGPWAVRFKRLAPANVMVLGTLSATQLADFYNAIDIFVNPTLRSQGLDHTLLEAMLCGKPLLATRFASITKSIIVKEGARGEEEISYTFSPTDAPASLIAALRLVLHHHASGQLQRKGQLCFQRASKLFTATRMAASYERLFLCITNSRYCLYPP